MYTIAGPPGAASGSAEADVLTLADEQGTTFARAGAGSVGAGDGAVAHVQYFAAPARPAAAGTLRLRLTLALAIAGPGPAGLPGPAVPPTPAAGRQVPPPFIFDFGLAAGGSKTTIEVGQRADAAGVAITLRRVLVGTTVLQATLCFAPADPARPPALGARGAWSPLADLDGNDGQSHHWTGSEQSTDNGGEQCGLYEFDGPGVAMPGARTLTVTDLLGRDATARVTGPWIFRFILP